MSVYHRILLAIDLNADSASIVHRAHALAKACGAELELLHILEYVPVEPLGESLMPSVEIEGELLSRARAELVRLAAEVGVAPSACHIEAGHIKAQIVRVARERCADLIVVSSRERHGPSILLNLTDDSVLHAAPCDVLAMRPLRPG